MACKFYSAYNRPKTIPHPEMFKVTMEHSKHVDEKTGREYLVKDRKVHNYDMVQEGREETLIDNIIRKCTEGNQEILDQIQGQYIDITNHVTSLMDAQNMVLKAREEFYNMPLEIRKQFDNDPSVYMAEYGSEEWTKKMGFKKEPAPTPEPTPAPEVKGEPANE